MSERRDVAKTTRRQDEAIHRYLVAFIGQVRALFKRRAPAHYERFPKAARPCATCALNPATDSWPGFEQTTANLMLAINQGAPFYCHTPEPVNGEYEVREVRGTRRLCAAWATICGDPNVKDVLIRAAAEVEGLTEATDAG